MLRIHRWPSIQEESKYLQLVFVAKKTRNSQSKTEGRVLKYSTMIFTWIKTESQTTFSFTSPWLWHVLITDKRKWHFEGKRNPRPVGTQRPRRPAWGRWSARPRPLSSSAAPRYLGTRLPPAWLLLTLSFIPWYLSMRIKWHFTTKYKSLKIN